MIGFIILIIAAFYKAFTGDVFLEDFGAMAIASIGELVLEFVFTIIFIHSRGAIR